MAELRDYLELTPSEARRQWERVRARAPRRRQEPFLPVETILCYGLFFVVNPHSYGGRNIDRAPAPIHRLAASLVRTPGSITSKMLNLDGSRAHGGTVEPEVFIRFVADPELFRNAYLVALQTAWDAGLTSQEVPDFLGLADSAFELLGQDEIGNSELSLAIREADAEITQWRECMNMSRADTERLVEQRARVGQHRFAREVLQNFDWTCAFCGFGPKHLLGHKLIVASHIKPWSKSNRRERLDPRNGVAACPVHDAAFDTGLLTVNGGLRVHRADVLEISLVHDQGVEEYFAPPTLRGQLVVPDGGRAPLERYLRFHQENVYKGYWAHR